MDFESQRKKRLEALEDKRKRLEEMRKTRQDRSNAEDTVEQDSKISQEEKRSSVDELVKSLLKPTSSLESSDGGIVENILHDNKTNSAQQAPSSSSFASTFSKPVASRRPLSVVKQVVSFHIAPIQPKDFYDKDCQTDDLEEIDDHFYDDVSSSNHTPSLKSGRLHRSASRSGTQTPIRSPFFNNIANLNDTFLLSNDSADVGDRDRDGLHISSGSNNEESAQPDMDIHAVMKDSKFLSFLSTKSRILEKALNKAGELDIFRDYHGDINSHEKRHNLQNKSLLSFASYDHPNVRGRPVMDMQFNPQFPELFLVAYGSVVSNTLNTKSSSLSNIQKSLAHVEETNGSEAFAPGIVCVWSTAAPSFPEFIFYASSPVLTARFVDEDPQLVVGGCYNGQILLWDMRAKATSLPMQRSSVVGSKGHRHPVYSMAIIQQHNSPAAGGGGMGGCEIFTSSVDGVCCQWDISRLTEPLNFFALPMDIGSVGTPGSSGGLGSGRPTPTVTVGMSNGNPGPVNISAMSFGQDEVSKYAVFGTGSGHILKCQLPYRSDEESYKKMDAHTGLVTAVEVHPQSHQLRRNLMLTSSLDWKVNLWDMQHTPDPSSGTPTSTHTPSSSSSPFTLINSFQTPSYDYVSDVKWCPANPAVFALITSSGDVILYNLSKSMSEPLDTTSLNASLNTASTGTVNTNVTVTLNKLMWSGDGMKLFIGDARGIVHGFNVQDHVIARQPGDDVKFELAILSRLPASFISAKSTTA